MFGLLYRHLGRVPEHFAVGGAGTKKGERRTRSETGTEMSSCGTRVKERGGPNLCFWLILGDSSNKEPKRKQPASSDLEAHQREHPVQEEVLEHGNEGVRLFYRGGGTLP